MGMSPDCSFSGLFPLESFQRFQEIKDHVTILFWMEVTMQVHGIEGRNYRPRQLSNFYILLGS